MPGRDDDWEDERQGPGRWLRIWSLILLILLVLVAMSLRITDINVIGNSRYTEEEITEDLNDQLNRICRNSRNWSGWKEAIYDRMDFLMKANGLK